MATRTDAVTLADRWTAMWNGDLAVVDEILAPQFSIEFGAVITDPDPASIATPSDMARFVAKWRERHGDLRFELQQAPAFDDAAPGSLAFVWSVAIPDVGKRSGIDYCHLRDSRISRVWSVTGDRLFEAQMPEVNGTR